MPGDAAADEKRLDAAAVALPAETIAITAAQRALRGESRGLKALAPFLGPAFVASVAYIDPGNFATNVASGAQYGYQLVWVVVVANLMAMLIQSMSAKLGIATGLNLAEVCRNRFRRPLVLGLWAQAEVVAIATDLAEVVGAAIGLNLLVGIPLFPAGVITGLVAFGILGLQSRGFRPLEVVISGLVAVIVVAFGFEVVVAQPSLSGIAGGLKPTFGDTGSVLLGVGILGATVMPHVIYLHSALTQSRIAAVDPRQRRRIYLFERWDIVIAMSVAGLVNVAMLVTAAAVFHEHGQVGVGDLGDAFGQLGLQLGRPAALVFGVALVASGLSSASVGTMAGQVVMQGFIRRRIPLLLRRAVTMIPALVVLGLGVNASAALVISQVVLSFGIPFALVPLVFFCADGSLMGPLVNRRSTTMTAAAVAAVIVLLNISLLWRLLSAG